MKKMLAILLALMMILALSLAAAEGEKIEVTVVSGDFEVEVVDPSADWVADEAAKIQDFVAQGNPLVTYFTGCGVKNSENETGTVLAGVIGGIIVPELDEQVGEQLIAVDFKQAFLPPAPVDLLVGIEGSDGVEYTLISSDYADGIVTGTFSPEQLALMSGRQVIVYALGVSANSTPVDVDEHFEEIEVVHSKSIDYLYVPVILSDSEVQLPLIINVHDPKDYLDWENAEIAALAEKIAAGTAVADCFPEGMVAELISSTDLVCNELSVLNVGNYTPDLGDVDVLFSYPTEYADDTEVCAVVGFVSDDNTVDYVGQSAYAKDGGVAVQFTGSVLSRLSAGEGLMFIISAAK